MARLKERQSSGKTRLGALPGAQNLASRRSPPQRGGFPLPAVARARGSGRRQTFGSDFPRFDSPLVEWTQDLDAHGLDGGMDGRRRTVSHGLGPYGDLRRQVDDAGGRVGPS